jgi:hypothetical protein
VQRNCSQRGAVYVEFLIIFLPILLFFLFIMHISFLYAGKIGLLHAAGRTARSAVVILDDDPDRYDGQERRNLTFSGNCGQYSPATMMGKLATAASAGTAPPAGNANCDGGPRAAAVRSVAAAAMAPYAPAIHRLVLSNAGGGMAGNAVGKLIYGAVATAVTFPTAPGQTQFRTSFGENDQVTVRVSFLQICPIPIASLFMCDRVSSLESGIDVDMGKRRTAVNETRAWERLRRAEPRVAELFAHSAYPEMLLALMLTESRFKVLHAESTLPLQGANYPYQSELE